MPNLTMPASAPSLADAVVMAVRDGVRSGDLLPGVTYSVYQLADELGVSRSPVREAVTRLSEAGLVKIARNRGFQVLVPTAADIADIMDVRMLLEVPASGRAAHGTAEQHAAIRGALEAMLDAARTGDEETYWPADRALHEALLRAAGNPRAADIVARLRETTALLGPPTTAAGRTLAEIAEEHRPVVDAVLAGDGERAEAAMRAHLEQTSRLLRERVHGAGGSP